MRKDRHVLCLRNRVKFQKDGAEREKWTYRYNKQMSNINLY